jgi:hypothetical protein
MFHLEPTHHKLCLQSIFLMRIVLQLPDPHIFPFLHLLDQPCVLFSLLPQLALQFLHRLAPLYTANGVLRLEFGGSFLDFVEEAKLLHLFFCDFGLAEGALCFLFALLEDDGVDAVETAAVLGGAKHHGVSLLIVVGL